MNRGESEYPIIAIIASDSEMCCRWFLQAYNLNPRCFKIITKYYQAQGIKKHSLPVIIVSHKDSREFRDLYEILTERFRDIRFMG